MTLDQDSTCQKPWPLEPAMPAIALIAAALVLGLTLSHVLQAPGSRSLADSQWLAVQHSFYGGFAVVGGAAEMIGLIASSWLAAMWMLRPRWTAVAAPLVATLCLLGTLLMCWLGNRPINAMIASWTPTILPPDRQVWRGAWKNAHAVSAGLRAAAFFTITITITFACKHRSAPQPCFSKPWLSST